MMGIRCAARRLSFSLRHRSRNTSPALERTARRVANLVARGFLVAGVLPATAAARRPITLEDLWLLERVGAPAVAPDGRRGAFTVTAYSMADNKGQGDLWVTEADGKSAPRRLTTNEGTDSSPRWSPDGAKLAYVSKRGDEPAQLFLLSFAGGEPERLTQLPVAVSDPRWFPDGRRLAALLFGAGLWALSAQQAQQVQKPPVQREIEKTKAPMTPIGFITITSPKPGDRPWFAGYIPNSILWTKAGPQPADVKIELRDAGCKGGVLVIAENTPNDGGFTWTVPESVPDGSYTIRISGPGVS